MFNVEVHFHEAWNDGATLTVVVKFKNENDIATYGKWS